MRKRLLSLLFALFCVTGAGAQNLQNNAADRIVGTYSGVQHGEKYRAKVVKLSDGTFQGQIVWMEHDKGPDGKKLLDTKNPDKKLRNTPLDRVVMFKGLKYNAKKDQWDGAKIYDPERGIRANLTVFLEKDGRLRIKGSLLGISESVYWKRE